MKSKDEIFDAVLGKEGGYVNHPDDRGGPTKWGITEKVARAHGYRGDMRDLTRGTPHCPGCHRRCLESGRPRRGDAVGHCHADHAEC